MKTIAVLRKPLEGTVAQNCLTHGCGALNIDGCRVGTSDNLGGGRLNGPTDIRGGGYESKRPSGGHVLARGDGVSLESNPAGRWPANVVLHEKVVAELDNQSGVSSTGLRQPTGNPIYSTEGSSVEWNSNDVMDTTVRGYDDTGGASRFFKQVKE